MSDDLNDSLSYEYSSDEYPIYLAHDAQLKEEEVTLAFKVLTGMGTIAEEERRETTAETKTSYPYIETATSIGHWVYLKNILSVFQNVLNESLDSSEKVSDLILRMSAVMAAHYSIQDQMTMVYLNLFQIAKEIKDDEDINKAVTAAAEEFLKNLTEGDSDEARAAKISLDNYYGSK